MTKFDGIIFDMDGLLFDTEMIYYQSTQKVADQLGFPYSKEMYLQFLGVSDEEVQENYHRIYKDFGEKKVTEFIELSYADVLQEFEKGTVPLKKGAKELLEFLHEQKIPRVVASSNVRSAIELLLESAGIRSYFDTIISAEDVTRAKPDPEIFQKAVAHLQTDNQRTLVLEDSEHGVNAAYHAGIPVIMVPDLLQPSEELQQKTLHVLESLIEVPDYIK